MRPIAASGRPRAASGPVPRRRARRRSTRPREARRRGTRRGTARCRRGRGEPSPRASTTKAPTPISAQHAPRRPRRAAVRGVQHDREGAPDEELGDAGVGPVVQAVEARAAFVEHEHERGRRQRTGGERRADRPRATERSQQDEQHERHEDVELLFDRERPEVLHRRRRREQVRRTTARWTRRTS